MKRILFLFAATALLFSCSDDKENPDDQTDQAKLQGTWDASELKIDDQTASDEAKFGRSILDHLTNKSCYIVTFTFNADLTIVVENSVNYLSIDVNSGGTGLDIPCPSESDTDTSVYTFDGTTLTYVDADGQTVAVTPTFDGNTMTITATDLGYQNLDVEGELVFTKR